MAGIYGIPESFQEPSPTPEPDLVPLPNPARHVRPDKATVVRRDREVLALVREAGSISRLHVAEKLGLTPHEAYLSLNRIMHTGAIRTVRRDNAHVWLPVSPQTPEA
jgi:hypothetical protein